MASSIKVTDKNCGGLLHNFENDNKYVIYGLGSEDIAHCPNVLIFENINELEKFIESLQSLKRKVEEDNETSRND